MKVKVKAEIVTLGAGDLDPASQAGRYLDPAEWNALIADPDTIVIDTRNAYEVAVGSFERAIDPGTRSFREFPAWFDRFAEQLREEGREPRIAMFCTGGIRCEKSTALVRSRGFEHVYHLRGGILRYLEEMPEEQSRWQGDCYVFDERVSVGHGLAPGNHVICRDCGLAHRPDAAHRIHSPPARRPPSRVLLRRGLVARRAFHGRCLDRGGSVAGAQRPRLPADRHGGG